MFKKNKIDYSSLISKLERGSEEDIQNLLWQPKKGTVEYLSITTSLVQQLKKQQSSEAGLSIHQQVEKNNYELIIFNLPWKDDVPYSPLIIDKSVGKIVGIMLPFNELHSYLSNRDAKTISELALIWTTFVIKFRFKK